MLRRLLEEVDLHYLVVVFVVIGLTLLLAARFPVQAPPLEIAMAVLMAIGGNITFLLLCFVGLAPWSFDREGMIRCLYWVPANWLAGSLLTFLMFLPRVLYAVILEAW